MRKIVLHCPTGYRVELDALVENLLTEGVKFVGVVGRDCSRVEDIIDELVVGDGNDPRRFILTSSHPDETVEQAVEFAEALSNDYGTRVEVVVL